MAYSLFTVLVPFYRADMHAIKMKMDLIFLDRFPIAVLEWATDAKGRLPMNTIRLDRNFLAKNPAPDTDYVYGRVVERPHPVRSFAALPTAELDAEVAKAREQVDIIQDLLKRALKRRGPI